MDAQVWLSVATFVLGALWTTGGRAALQRRVVENELNLAEKLVEEPMKTLMARRAHDRAAIYLARGLESDLGRRGLAPMLPLLGGTVLVFGAAQLPGGVSDWIEVGGSLLGIILVGGGFGAIVDAVFRDGRAWLGSARVSQARRRLTEAVKDAEKRALDSDLPPLSGP